MDIWTTAVIMKKNIHGIMVMEGDEAEQDNIYRWFEVPDDWTKEDVLEQLKKV